MEQRPLRLGDLVDDYCPRERRLTNHAVVAIVGNTIKQTRCSTCEADHPYKEGKVPRRRKKDASGELYDQVLAGVTGQLVTPAAAEAPEPSGPPSNVEAEAVASAPAPARAEVRVAAAIVVKSEIVVERVVSPEPQSAIDGVAPAAPAADDLWPAHRPLIRAQLPRVEGQQPAQPQRPIHEFTMRQNGRGNQSFRGGQGGWSDRGGQNGTGRDNGRGGGFRQGRQEKFGGGGGGRPNANANGGGRPKRSR